MFITLSSPLLISFVHSLTQLISNYWESTLYQPTFKVLTLFFLFFLSLQRSLAGILANRRQVEWNSPFIRIVYSHFASVLSSVLCLLLCFPSMCSHTFFLALGSISIFLSRAEWLLRVENFIENFKFQSQECCSDCFIAGGKSPLSRPGSLRLLTWKLLKF